MIPIAEIESEPMFRAREPQRNLFSARNQYLDLIGRKSFYAMLAEHGDQLFADHKFEGMYCDDNGRPCIPPSQMFMMLLLQMHDKCSDYEAIERSRCDIRWLAALDLEIGQKLCGRSTLQEFRARVHLKEATEEQFKSILKLARRLGILKGPSLKVALDTTPVLGRGAVKDTYNLIADGIRKLVGVLAKLDHVPAAKWARSQDLSRYWEASSLKGEAEIDWSDDKERRVFLNGLVADAERLLMVAHKRAADASKEDADRIEDASALIKRLIAQDTEPDPDVPGNTRKKGAVSSESRAPHPDTGDAPNAGGDPATPEAASQQPEVVAEAPAGAPSHMVRIAEGVATDRLISVQDPEMRHGRKSASHRFNGHKLAICVDTDSKLILDVDVIAGNAPDNQGALAMTQRAANNTGLSVAKTLGDCAYGDGLTRQAFDEAGIELSAKVPSPPANDPFSKARFILDLTNKIATCPAGQTTSDYDHAYHRHGTTERFRFPAHVCQACPHRAECLRAADQGRNRGRTITLHPQEHLLQRARQHQATPAFREDIKARQAVEHRLARIIQLGGRQARYPGRKKTKYQALMIAMVANLTLMAGALALFPPLTGLAAPLLRCLASHHQWSPIPRDGRLEETQLSQSGGLRLAS